MARKPKPPKPKTPRQKTPAGKPPPGHHKQPEKGQPGHGKTDPKGTTPPKPKVHHESKKTRAKISKALQGHHESKKTRQKISRSLRARAKARAAIGPALDTQWILGSNDQLPTCVIAAVANHRWLATGLRMTDQEVCELFDAVGHKAGASIEAVLANLDCQYWAAEYDGSVGQILGMMTSLGAHAALALGGGYLASWGTTMPLFGTVEEAWDVKWRT